MRTAFTRRADRKLGPRPHAVTTFLLVSERIPFVCRACHAKSLGLPVNSCAVSYRLTTTETQGYMHKQKDEEDLQFLSHSFLFLSLFLSSVHYFWSNCAHFDNNNNNNNNPICKAPECQKTSVALKCTFSLNRSMIRRLLLDFQLLSLTSFLSRVYKTEIVE